MTKKKLKKEIKRTVQGCHERLSQALAIRRLIERLASTGENAEFEGWELRAITDAMICPVDEVWDELDRLSMRVNKPKKTVTPHQVV